MKAETSCVSVLQHDDFSLAVEYDTASIAQPAIKCPMLQSHVTHPGQHAASRVTSYSVKCLSPKAHL